jgi:Domain of unknown function (DUF4169)
MADIVNLRRARKDKERREHDSQAKANRRCFGRTKAEKAADEDAVRRSRQALDDKRLQTEDDEKQP